MLKCLWLVSLSAYSLIAPRLGHFHGLAEGSDTGDGDEVRGASADVIDLSSDDEEESVPSTSAVAPRL